MSSPRIQTVRPRRLARLTYLLVALQQPPVFEPAVSRTYGEHALCWRINVHSLKIDGAAGCVDLTEVELPTRSIRALR